MFRGFLRLTSCVYSNSNFTRVRLITYTDAYRLTKISENKEISEELHNNQCDLESEDNVMIHIDNTIEKSAKGGKYECQVSLDNLSSEDNILTIKKKIEKDGFDVEYEDNLLKIGWDKGHISRGTILGLWSFYVFMIMVHYTINSDHPPI